MPSWLCKFISNLLSWTVCVVMVWQFPQILYDADSWWWTSWWAAVQMCGSSQVFRWRSFWQRDFHPLSVWCHLYSSWLLQLASPQVCTNLPHQIVFLCLWDWCSSLEHLSSLISSCAKDFVVVSFSYLWPRRNVFRKLQKALWFLFTVNGRFDNPVTCDRAFISPVWFHWVSQMSVLNFCVRMNSVNCALYDHCK